MSARLGLCAVTSLLAAGCSCGGNVYQVHGGNPLDLFNPSVEKWCTERLEGPCPTEAEEETALLEQARRRWLKMGECDGLEAGWYPGGTWLVEGGGFCGAQLYFSRDGALQRVTEGCEAEVKTYGWVLNGAATTTRDLCKEAAAGAALAGVTFEVESVDAELDGEPLKADTPTTIPPGPHRFAVGGQSLPLTFVQTKDRVYIEVEKGGDLALASGEVPPQQFDLRYGSGLVLAPPGDRHVVVKLSPRFELR